jgi:hypothetical protein
MKTTKITEKELVTNSVANLPTRPNAPYAFGGTGLTAAELKAAFDALPILIARRFNLLLEDICAEHGASITGSVKTGIEEDHTLQDMLDDIKDGSFVSYLAAPEGTLAEYLLALREDVNRIAEALGLEL